MTKEDKIFVGDLEDFSTEEISEEMGRLDRIRKYRKLTWDEKIMYEHLYNETCFRVA